MLHSSVFARPYFSIYCLYFTKESNKLSSYFLPFQAVLFVFPLRKRSSRRGSFIQGYFHFHPLLSFHYGREIRAPVDVIYARFVWEKNRANISRPAILFPRRRSNRSGWTWPAIDAVPRSMKQISKPLACVRAPD